MHKWSNCRNIVIIVRMSIYSTTSILSSLFSLCSLHLFLLCVPTTSIPPCHSKCSLSSTFDEHSNTEWKKIKFITQQWARWNKRACPSHAKITWIVRMAVILFLRDAIKIYLLFELRFKKLIVQRPIAQKFHWVDHS